MILKDIHPIERPRERLAALSPEALSDQELLALILRTGYAGQGVMDLAASVLKAFEDPKAFPEGLARAGYQRLKALRGMGQSRAASLVAAFELARRLGPARDPRPVLDCPARVLDQLSPAVRGGRKEHFVAFYLNARSQMLHYETVSIGTLSASLVHPREVFAPAISHTAAALIVAHNHPSGDCTPSSEDKDATRRLSRSGELLGIPLLDHLIVAERGFFSFKEHGLLA